MRQSGLQRQVLALYRRCMRESRKKPPETRINFEEFTRDAFRQHIALDKKDFGAIEYLLRRGLRQVDIYSDPNIKNILQNGER